MRESEAWKKFNKENPELGQLITTLQDVGVLAKIDATIDPTEEMIVMCGPESNITGSKQVTCGCGALVWISPSTQKALAAHSGPRTLKCPSCLEGFLKQVGVH